MAPELVAGGGYGGLIREKPHCGPARLNPSRLGSARYSGLGASRLVTRARLGLGWGLGNQLNARLSQLGPGLGIQLGAQLDFGWGIGIRFGLAQGSARLTCLGLVLGIGSGLGSAWKPGPAPEPRLTC